MEANKTPEPNQTQIGEWLLIVLVAIPVLGILFGGIYTWPAMTITKCREPAYTLLLSLGLGITVFGVGLGMNLPIATIAVTYICSLVLLGVRRAFGPMDHNMERFGLIHATVLLAVVLVSTLYRRASA